MLVIAIDGACRRNGKETCVAAGGVLILHRDTTDETFYKSTILSNFEIASTNQRGELLALLTALDYVWEAKLPANIVTDSEYIFNAMTKEWYKGWSRKGWVTVAGEPVKNKDIWLEILNAMCHCEQQNIEVAFFHIKGHCMPFGKVTARSLLMRDTTGRLMLDAAFDKYDTYARAKVERLEAAQALFLKNSGFKPSKEILRLFIVINTVADAVATECVEAADALMTP